MYNSSSANLVYHTAFCADQIDAKFSIQLGFIALELVLISISTLEQGREINPGSLQLLMFWISKFITL